MASIGKAGTVRAKRHKISEDFVEVGTVCQLSLSVQELRCVSYSNADWNKSCSAELAEMLQRK